MIRNYLTIALRNLWKNKAHTLINVLGLALGIASSIIIFFIVSFELSYDDFHEKSDRIYRLTLSGEREGESYYNNTVPMPLPGAIRKDFTADIEEVLRIERVDDRILLEGKTVLIKEDKAFTENAYFSLFNFPLIAGNPETILKQPNEVVLTRSLSAKLYGDYHKAIGSTFTLLAEDQEYELEVKGIMEDLPENTDFTYEMLISSAGREEETNWDFYFSSFNAFVLLPEKTDAVIIEERLNLLHRQYADVAHINKNNVKIQLQPLSDIHYNDQYSGFPYHKMSKANLAGLSAIAGILLLLGCINFVNLATAISTKRNKEIGIRKTLGSNRRQIILHLLGEAFIITVLAMILSLGLAEFGLLYLKKLYANLAPVNLHFTVESGFFFLVILLLVTLLAGLYPSWLLSRFKPVHMFKAPFTTLQQKRFSLRQSLVVFQFFVSQVFIVCTLVIAQQMNFLMNAPLGFDTSAVITLDLADEDPQNRERFASMLSGESGVRQLSFSAFSAISQNMYGGIYEVDGREEDDQQVSLQFADEHFFETHNMQLLAGEVYIPSDSGSGFVANASFVRTLGLQDPEQALGKYVTVWGMTLPVVGVVADYHANSFEDKIEPMLITNQSSFYSSLNLKVNRQQAAEVIEKLEASWKLTYPEYDFSYEFLDERVRSFYLDYERNLSLAQLFAGMTILIGCLGLYGLVMFMAERRTKEVGIRKVLGASLQQIVVLFSKEFIKLILVAFVLAAPLAYYLSQQWLRTFAYTVEITAFTFAICLAAIMVIVLLTVGYQSIKAALANPVKSLRNE